MNTIYIAAWGAVSLLLVVVLSVITYRLRSRVRALEARYERLVEGTEGGALEAVLFQHADHARQAIAIARQTEQRVQQLTLEAQTHLQHCGVVRFNTFLNTGGDQSFCLVLADATGRGVILTSLHAREATRIYAKPLVDWRSPYPLTEEEQRAIHQALTREMTSEPLRADVSA